MRAESLLFEVRFLSIVTRCEVSVRGLDQREGVTRDGLVLYWYDVCNVHGIYNGKNPIHCISDLEDDESQAVL